MMLRPPQLRRSLPTLSRWMSSGRSSSSGGSRNIGPASINDLNLMNEFQTPKNDEIGDHGNPYQLSLIQRCGRRGFTAANFKFRGGLVLVSGGMFLWDVSRASDLKREHFALFELLDPLPGTVRHLLTRFQICLKNCWCWVLEPIWCRSSRNFKTCFDSWAFKLK